MDLYPYRFSPIYQERLWGGRNLARLFARILPEGKQIGESWELADLPQGASVVANGPLAGRTITDLTRELGPSLLGRARPMPDGRFPLLLKYLDAEETLSLQVHPDEEAARRLGGGAALKTECWYVVESRGGFLYKGLRPGVTRQQFLDAVQAARAGAGGASAGRAEAVLQRYDVAAGDFHYVPAGTVHALGAGVVVAEIQTPSDTTFRVSDWGRGRQTHLDEAMQCIHFGEPPCPPPGGGGEALVSTDYFTIAHRTARAHEPIHWDLSAGRCAAIMVLRGSLSMKHSGVSRVEPVVDAAAGHTVLLPAGLDFVDGESAEDVSFLEIGVAR